MSIRIFFPTNFFVWIRFDLIMYFMRMIFALQELLNICHSYSITVDVNFNALKSFCVAFTPKLF